MFKLTENDACFLGRLDLETVLAICSNSDLRLIVTFVGAAIELGVGS